MGFRVLPGVSVENFFEDALLVDAKNNVFVLNKTALFFWEALANGEDLSNVACRFDDADREKINADLEFFLRQLVEYRLAERVSELKQ